MRDTLYVRSAAFTVAAERDDEMTYSRTFACLFLHTERIARRAQLLVFDKWPDFDYSRLITYEK
jgi:hypothetical protein